MESDESVASSAQGDWLAPLMQAWAHSQQAVGLFDEQDRLQYANATYRTIFSRVGLAIIHPGSTLGGAQHRCSAMTANSIVSLDLDLS
jgi:hypothetical protein